MKIDKEQFNKLKQLDRIELRTRRNFVWLKTNTILTLCSLMVLMILFLITFTFLGDIYFAIKGNLIRVIFFSILTIILTTSLLIPYYLIHKTFKKQEEEEEELINEYFKVEVKK